MIVFVPACIVVVQPRRLVVKLSDALSACVLPFCGACTPTSDLLKYDSVVARPIAMLHELRGALRELGPREVAHLAYSYVERLRDDVVRPSHNMLDPFAQ